MTALVAQVGGYLRNLHRTLRRRERMRVPDSYLARAAVGSLGLRAASLGLGFICYLLLTRLLGAHAYGIYAYALAWVMALSVPATLGLDRLLVREVAIYHARSDWASWRGVTLVSLPLALAFIIFRRPLLLVFGAPFAAGTTALSLLCVGHIVNMFAGAIGLLLVMTGHEREVAFVSTACALLNFVLCILLIPRWGMAGAAAGAATSMIIWNLWLARRVWRLLGIRSTIFARAVQRPHEPG